MQWRVLKAGEQWKSRAEQGEVLEGLLVVEAKGKGPGRAHQQLIWQGQEVTALCILSGKQLEGLAVRLQGQPVPPLAEEGGNGLAGEQRLLQEHLHPAVCGAGTARGGVGAW